MTAAPPPPRTPAPGETWTGQQWGAFYASVALSLGEYREAHDILEAVLGGKWDDHEDGAA